MEIRSTKYAMKQMEKRFRKPRFFYKMFWTDIYYETKWKVWALRKYFPIVLKMKSYDYHSILEMLQFQLGVLNSRLENGLEIEETRIPKVNDIKEVINLIENKLEENYGERIESKRPDYDIWFDKVEGKEYFEMKDNDPRTEEEKDEYFKQYGELEETEWKKIFELLQKMRSWWD